MDMEIISLLETLKQAEQQAEKLRQARQTGNIVFSSIHISNAINKLQDELIEVRTEA